MAQSENGWEVIDSQSSPKLVVIKIPTTTIPLRLRKECASLLAHVAYRVHKEVSDLKQNNKPGFQDEGGWNYRKIDHSIKFSNHASGTAIDLNWQKYPMFRKNMRMSEMKAAQAIAEELKEVIRWGGNYSLSRVDQMHWEIAPKVTAQQIKEFCTKHGIKKDGTVTR
jgi:hypothetical protein